MLAFGAGTRLAEVHGIERNDEGATMHMMIHIDGPVHYEEAGGRRFLVPLGPCGAELRPADGIVRLHWRRAAGDDSTAFTIPEFEAYQRNGHIKRIQ